MKRDDIVQICLIAIGAGATGFALSFMVIFGIKQEALFALVGAIIGVAATIGGAAWLADRSRVIERDAEISLLVAEYKELLEKAVSAQKAEPGTNMPWPKDYRPKLYVLAETAGDVHAIAQEALAHAKALSFVHRAAVRRVQFVIDEYLRFWTDANEEGELHPLDERNFPEVTAHIAHECKMAIAELEGSTPYASEVPQQSGLVGETNSVLGEPV